MKKHFKFGILIMLLLLLVYPALTGCSKTSTEKDGILIGLSLDSIVVERWQRELEIIVSSVNEMGAEIDVQIANEDLQKQTDQIKYLIDKKVDVLIVVPNDARGFFDVLTEADRNNIPVIAYDRLIMHPNIDLYISFDNVEIGKGISKKLLDEMLKNSDNSEQLADEPLNLVIINGDPKDNNSILLNKGFYETLQPILDQGLVNVVEETWANEWREQYASDSVEKVLASGKKIDGIIAANDVLATGAIEVLSRWRLAGTVPVVSQDAELSACQRIVEETQLATAYKPIYDLAKLTAKVAVGMARGEKIITNDTIYNSFESIPYLKLDAYVVDKDNLDAVIIQGGFHRKEDIYRNIDSNN